MGDDREAVLQALDERARSEPRLHRYRVVGNGAALRSVPDDWFVSDAIARIAREGGWWPGEWLFPFIDDTFVELVLTADSESRPDANTRWLGVGSVWERDWFWTPALRTRSSSAPLFGFSSQAL